MSNETPKLINIGLIGGGPICFEFIKKSSLDYHRRIHAEITAVADPDPKSPGMALARKMKLKTETDYHNFYAPEYDIQLIILLTPETETLEDVLATKPGNIRLVSYTTFEILWTAIGLEERKLRERTTEMETLINGIRDFILVITPGMEITDVNEAFLQKMGYTREETIGRKCYEVYHKLDRPCEESRIDCPLNGVIRNRRQYRQVQTRLLPNGEKRYYEVHIYPIWEKDGKISKFVHISRDITQHKQKEEEITSRLEHMVEERTRQLKETHTKLLHQDKMASLGKLSASVVHEINNPIAGILNLIMLIKRIMEEGVLSEKELTQFAQYLDLMETETRRTSRIVSNLLAFSRQSRMELKKINLNQLIEKTLILNSNLLKIEGAKIEKELSPDLPDLVGTEDQLLQVFMNIVSNAAEAIETAGGGILRIETRQSLRNGSVTAVFRDTGIGIPRENMAKLFEPFFTTKKKGKGVGLGLSVAYGIIEEHGGTINVTSSEKKGTTFTIKLPLNPSPITTDSNGGLHGQYENPDR